MKREISEHSISAEVLAALGRREFLLRSSTLVVAASALGTTPMREAFGQQLPPSITVIIPNVHVPDELRNALDKKSGVKMENAPYVSPTDTMAKLMAPGGTARYDLMASNTKFAIGPVLREKAGEELARPFNMKNVPNADRIHPRFQGDIIKRDGKTYLIPYLWGYDTCIFNKAVVPEDDALTQSWGLLFDEKYAGRVAVRDDAHASIIPTALYMGVEDPFKMDRKDLNEIVQFLIAKKKKNHFRTLWSKFGEAINLMSSGEVVALNGWIPMRAPLEKQGMKVASNFPREGTIVWSFSCWIPRDSKNADSAEKVMNELISTDIGIKLTELTQYPATNADAMARFSREDRRKLGFDVMDRGVKLVDYKFPPNLDEWIEAWARFKAA